MQSVQCIEQIPRLESNNRQTRNLKQRAVEPTPTCYVPSWTTLWETRQPLILRRQRAPSLEEELARGVPARRDENPHLTNLDAVSASDPIEVLFYNNLEKVFVKNSGQFPRIVLDLPFLLEGQDSNIVTTVVSNPNGWLPVVHALGGRYLYSKVPDIVDSFATTLSEAVGCPEMMVLRSQIPPPSKPSRGRGQRGGNPRGRGGRGGTSESSRTQPYPPPTTSQELFAPPYAAFLEAPSPEICDRFFRQQTFSKDKITTAHIVPTTNKYRNWTVGQFWTTVKKYDDTARVSILFAMKSHLFNNRTFRNKVQTTSAATGNLDNQVFAFLDAFGLHLQEYKYHDGRMSQRRWVLYAAPISMAENLFVREQQEDEIHSYIRKQTYSHGIYLVQGTTMNCSLCKAQNHNRFACPFTEHKDWQGPDASENVKEIARQDMSKPGDHLPAVLASPCVVGASGSGGPGIATSNTGVNDGYRRVRVPLKHKRLWMHGADQKALIEVPGSIAQPVLSIAPGQQLHRSWTNIQMVRL
ncbi:hypothetical protein BDP27DRAFT_1372671 [Rhodocollybia butyracea]|uniref:Uncharacterized protein n=1 Tax=Rhodocollybia butyracea TaxID=206335 RepID=A0A9P5TXQ9_9AGAR|nr:hypothetical protein BDP27DRAFT_1372671 [Rhodocollybia butyracea]